jgi:hypothetical protein
MELILENALKHSAECRKDKKANLKILDIDASYPK